MLSLISEREFSMTLERRSIFNFYGGFSQQQVPIGDITSGEVHIIKNSIKREIYKELKNFTGCKSFEKVCFDHKYFLRETQEFININSKSLLCRAITSKLTENTMILSMIIYHLDVNSILTRLKHANRIEGKIYCSYTYQLLEPNLAGFCLDRIDKSLSYVSTSNFLDIRFNKNYRETVIARAELKSSVLEPPRREGEEFEIVREGYWYTVDFKSFYWNSHFNNLQLQL